MLTQLFERSRTRPATEFATIVADPGLGKSRLVRELANHVESLPELVRWRVGRCLPYGEGIGFWALGEVTKAEAGILETDDQATLRDKLERAVTEPDPQTKTWMVDRLAPLVGLETSTAAPEQTEAFTAWRRFLESLATQGPTVVVVEDLHWADPGFVAFLEHLAERTAGLPLLVVVTARPEVEERHPSWPPGRRSSVLSLSPLTDADVEALIRESLPGASDELTTLVLERAGGSPLYAEQLAAMLHESALPIAGGAIDEALIPQSIQALIAARIDALTAETKRVLMQASVVGKTFWAGALASLGDHSELEETLGELVRRELCRPAHPSTIEGDREFSFWHALVRDVAYAELTKAERARLHAGVATWIVDRTGEAMGEEAEIVVHHLDAALELAPSAPELATEPLHELLATALLAAGEAAMRTDIPRAIPYLERAIGGLEAEDDDALRTKHLLARAYTAVGEHDDARTVWDEILERYLELGMLEEAINVVWELVPIYQSTGDVVAYLRRVEELRALVGSEPSATLVAFLPLEADMLEGQSREVEALQRARLSLAMADELGIPARLEAADKATVGAVRRGDASSIPDARRVVDAYLAEGRVMDALVTLYNLSNSLTGWRPREGLALMDESIVLAERVGADSALWISKAGRSLQLAQLGRFDDALAGIDEILEWTERTKDLFARMSVLDALAVVEIHRGGELVDPRELAELCRSVYGPQQLGTVVRVLHARGDDERAGDLLREAVDASVSSRDGLVKLALELGLTDLSDELLARERSGVVYGEASRAEAIADVAASRGEWREATARLREAIDAWGAFEQPLEVARCLQALGRVLLEAGEREEGVARLQEARERWEAMGATRKIAEIDELLGDHAT
jgi:tetratricopeptide (TPR) repeat protein